MRHLTKTLAAVALLSLGAEAASAAPAAKAAAAPAASGVTGEVRCLMSMLALSQQKDPKQQTAGALGVYFFAGRISVRSPGLNLAEAMKAQIPTMQGPQIGAELQRCGPQVQTIAAGVQAGIAGLRPPGAPATPAPAATAPVAPAPVPAAPAPAAIPPKK